MKRLQTFFLLMHKNVNQTYFKYIINVLHTARIEGRLSVKMDNINHEDAYQTFVNDINKLKSRTDYIVLQICTTGGSNLMQFKYIFDTEEMIFEYAANYHNEKIGKAVLHEVDFFNNIGYFENGNHD